MHPKSDPDFAIDSVLRDLQAMRQRLDQAPEWLVAGGTTISIAALAEEIRSFCEQASRGKDLQVVKSSIAEAEKLLHKLHTLLGAH